MRGEITIPIKCVTQLANKYLSYVGGAITSQSNPHNEYNECLLKAKAIIQALTSK
ncbi:MAG: chorismate-binding protein [Tenuifilaceae bacterium]|nr:chorismate-binding protein [Tenuifilaceae bacterium]